MVIDILINGLVAGGIYAVLAVGFSLICGVAKIINMAHTAFYMLTAYFIFVATSMLNIPLLASLVIAVALITVIGLICFKVLFDRVKQHETTVMIISWLLPCCFRKFCS